MRWVRWQKVDGINSVVHCENNNGLLLCRNSKGKTQFRVMWENWKTPLADQTLKRYCCKRCLRIAESLPGAFNARSFKKR